MRADERPFLLTFLPFPRVLSSRFNIFIYLFFLLSSAFLHCGRSAASLGWRRFLCSGRPRREERNENYGNRAVREHGCVK